jgi:type I restriction enzyme, S subunit
MTNVLPVVPLGEFLTQRKEFFTIDDFVKYKRARVQSHGQGIVLRDEVNGMEIKTKKQQAAQTGEFLVAEIDAKVGGFGIVPYELNGAVVSSHYFLFQIDESKCLKEWLHWFVRYNSLEEQTKAQGSTNYAAIRPNDVLSFEIPLPPLMEQRHIVAHIESLAAQVHEAQRLREEAEVEADSLTHSALNAIFNDSFTQKYPKHLLGVVADIRSGVTLGRILQGNTVRLPYLRVANVQDGYLDLRQVKEVEVLESEKDKWQLQRGDILLTEGGDWDKLGRGAVWGEEIPNCIHQNHIFRVRINQDEIVPEFLAMLISSPYGKNYFRAASKQTTNLASINNRQLRAFDVICPPLDEQRRIVAYLDGLQAKVNALRELQAESGKELSALMPSILDKAFKGEL